LIQQTLMNATKAAVTHDDNGIAGLAGLNNGLNHFIQISPRCGAIA
jgi:hypothetical protein